METFLRPIEHPHGLIMKFAYAMTRHKFGKVVTPLKVAFARLPVAFGLFSAKISKLDKKLTLPPETALLIRERVAAAEHLSVLHRYRPVVRHQGVDERSQVQRARRLRHESFIQRSRTRSPRLCDRTDSRQKGRPENLRPHGRPFFRTRDLRDCLARGDRTFLQHHEHRPQYPFGHALRYQPKAASAALSCQLPFQRPRSPKIEPTFPTVPLTRRMRLKRVTSILTVQAVRCLDA